MSKATGNIRNINAFVNFNVDRHIDKSIEESVMTSICLTSRSNNAAIARAAFHVTLLTTPAKTFIKVDSAALLKALNDETRFVTHNFAIDIIFDLVDPASMKYLCSFWKRRKIECLVFEERCKLFIHSFFPFCNMGRVHCLLEGRWLSCGRHSKAVTVITSSSILSVVWKWWRCRAPQKHCMSNIRSNS